MKRLILMNVFALIFISTSAQAADKSLNVQQLQPAPDYLGGKPRTVVRGGKPRTVVRANETRQSSKNEMYVSGNLGLVLVPDIDLDVPGFGKVVTGEFDLGFGISGAVGYDFGAIRAEGEISYRTNDGDVGTLIGLGSGPIDGDISALSFMVNGYYDLHSANSPLVPYLGVGLGVASIDADISAPVLAPFPQLVDDSATVFAYQFMAGLGYNISPTMILTADYRYFGTTSPEFTPGNAFIPGTPDIEADYSNHSFNIGVRFMF
jgi:opacity protein-like surface antigen